MNVGWDGHRRVYGCVLHLDIKQGKIWIEQNMTEMRVAQELVERGVAKEDIVLYHFYMKLHRIILELTRFSAL